MKYYFDVIEKFIKTIAVEADNLTEAESKLERAYNKEFKINRDYPDDVIFQNPQTEVEECIQEGFFAAEELTTII